MNKDASFLLTLEGAKDPAVRRCKERWPGMLRSSGRQRVAFTVYLENRIAAKKSGPWFMRWATTCPCKDAVGKTIRLPRRGAGLPLRSADGLRPQIGCERLHGLSDGSGYADFKNGSCSPDTPDGKKAWQKQPARLRCISPSSCLMFAPLLLLLPVW